MVDEIQALQAELLETQDRRGKIDIMNRLATALSEKGELMSAIDLSEKAIELSTQGDLALQPYEQGLAVSFLTLGRCYLLQAEHAPALDAFFKSLRLYNSIGDQRQIARLFHLTGVAYAGLEDHSRAKGYYLKGLELAEAVGDKRLVIKQLIGLAEVHLSKNNYDQGIKLIAHVLELTHREGYRYEEGEAWLSLANAYYLLRQMEQAISACSKALAIAREIDSPQLSLESKRAYDRFRELDEDVAGTKERFEGSRWIQRELQDQGGGKKTREARIEPAPKVDTAELDRRKVEPLEWKVAEYGQIEDTQSEIEAGYRSSLDNVPVGVYRIMPEGPVLFANPAAIRILGQEAFEGLIDKNAGVFQPRFAGRSLLESITRIGTVRDEERTWRRGDGAVVFLRWNARVVRGADGLIMYYEGVIENITQNWQLDEALVEAKVRLALQEAELENLEAGFHDLTIRDPFTGLFNRQYMLETLERELKRAQRKMRPLSLVLMEIDHFEGIRHSYGYRAGDRVLQTLSDLLRHQTRREDIVCRYGDQQFVVVLTDAPIQVTFKRANSWRLAFGDTRIIYREHKLQATLSAGIVAFPKHGTTVDDLLRTIEKALGEAKTTGGNRAVVWK